MRVEITEEQRERLWGILTTHLHNMRNEFVAAHGVDEKRATFYYERATATELLLPIFAAPEPAQEDDPDSDSEDEEAE